MRTWQIRPGDNSKSLALEDVATRKPGPGEARIRVHAAALNFRDLLALRGIYPLATDRPVVPLSDGAGEVTGVGANVTRVAVGDRVTATTISNWVDGALDRASVDQSIGFSVDGWLAEEIVLPESALVKLPDAMSYANAATLPCAGVTAWNAIVETARIGPGDRVLTLGTGGVSMFAIQITKLVGARVLVTSSSDAKLERVLAMGADDGVNYVSHPEWGEHVRELTGGVGVDLVIENAGTPRESLKSTRHGGIVAVIGMLAMFGSEDGGAAASADLPLMEMFRSGITLTPIYMGNRRMLARMVDAYVAHGMEPVIDQTFTFNDAPAAFDALAAARHIGKIVITV